jgi:hypothetical protein
MRWERTEKGPGVKKIGRTVKTKNTQNKQREAMQENIKANTRETQQKQNTIENQNKIKQRKQNTWKPKKI